MTRSRWQTQMNSFNFIFYFFGNVLFCIALFGYLKKLTGLLIVDYDFQVCLFTGCLCECGHVCVHKCIYTCVYLSVYVHVCMCACILYVYMCVHACVCVCVHMCVYTCTCTYVFVCSGLLMKFFCIFVLCSF